MSKFRFERIDILRKARTPNMSEQWDAMSEYTLRRDKVLGEVKKLKAIVDEAKSRPCADCKQSFPPEAMQFDHLPQFKKQFNISAYRVLTPSADVLQTEISKCEVVCANCHAVRTRRRSEDAKRIRGMH